MLWQSVVLASGCDRVNFQTFAMKDSEGLCNAVCDGVCEGDCF